MRYILLFACFLLVGNFAKASHSLGGEISYRCLGNGNYQFTIVWFRDCSGSAISDNSITLSGPSGNIVCPLINSYDVTPSCVAGTGAAGTFGCPLPGSTSNVRKGSIGKFVYRSGIVNLNSLAAAPPGGYTWYTTNITCCRNPNDNTSGCLNDMVLRVKMHRYVDATGTALTPAQMCDNSPSFLEDPAAVTIANPNDTAVFNNFAQDPDREDETRFRIDQPWSANGAPCNFIPPFSLTSPMRGLIGSAIDSVTGVITYIPRQSAAYLLVIKVESFRCGQLVSEVFRDFQLNVIPNPPGARPLYNPNTVNPIAQLSQQKAPTFVPLLVDAAGDPVYEIEVYAKDPLEFTLQAMDNFPLFDPGPDPNIPGAYNPDTVSIFVTGPQMGQNGTSTTICNGFPPCATLSQSGGTPPAPLRYYTAGEILGYGYKGESQVEAILSWTPDCNHLPANTVSSCGTGVSAYQFGLVAFDDACPVRGKTSQVYSIRVKTLPILDAPRLRTLSVDVNNAAVELTWSQFIDTTSIDPIDSINNPALDDSSKRVKSVTRRKASFVSYNVYRSVSPAGPFVQVGQSLALDDTFYVDNTVTPTVQYYYYVTTVSSCNDVESVPSNVAKTVDLQVTNNIVMGAADLVWDSLALNSLVPPTGTPVVFVEREVFSQNPGVWERVDTLLGVTQNSQPIIVCDDSVNYRVGYLDSSLVISYSWIAGDRFEDTFAPDQVDMVQASVDNATGTPYLTWETSPNPDVNRYIIYRVDPSTTPSTLFYLDTIFDPTATFWYDTFSGQNPADSSLLYGIAAMDSCGNLGLVSTTFNTIHLQADMNQCISSMELSWNQYAGWGDVQEYEIMRSDGAGAPLVSIATIPANNMTYDYIDNFNLIQDTVYCYEIQAIRANDSIAYSNRVCVQARVIKSPELTYIRKVNVDTATSLITVSFISDTAASSARYELQRGTSTADFQPIASVDLSQSTIVGPFHTFSYTDMEAKSGDRSYLYRVIAYDLCDQAFDTSEVASSIFLQGVPAIDFSNELKWNDYDSWLGGLETYTVMRYIPIVDLTYLPLNTTGAGSPVYNDDITDFTNNDGNYLYFIEALEGNSNPLGLKDTVHSNVVTVTQQPRIFFPNAFLPLGVNREFRGKGVFIEEGKGFNMQVYNRWGEKLFESNDFTLGWDGRAANDEFVMPGVYVYVVNFIGKNAKTYSQKGTLTILR